MKTDLTTPGSFAQGQAKLKAVNEQAQKPAAAPILPGPKAPAPDYVVELSGKAPSVPTPGLALSSESVPKLPETAPEDLIKEEIKKQPEIKKVEEERKGTQNRPVIVFIKGLDIFSSPLKSESVYAGLGKMADAIEGARLYGWDQKKEIIDEIQKVRKDRPVILVGHSLGGDTAVEIANDLDSLEHGFRTVDVLVTIDAVGFNNDIIPQNVKKHLNIFGENDFFLNDGPHVARRNELTEVINLLSPLDHTELDDDKEIQFEVVSLIRKTLNVEA